MMGVFLIIISCANEMRWGGREQLNGITRKEERKTTLKYQVNTFPKMSETKPLVGIEISAKERLSIRDSPFDYKIA